MANVVTQIGLRAVTQPDPEAETTQIGLRAVTQPSPHAVITQVVMRVIQQNIAPTGLRRRYAAVIG